MSALYSCREAVRLANQALDAPLGLRGQLELRVHLVLCSACRAYQRQARALDRLVRGRQGDIPGDEILTQEARQRISQALRRR